MSTLRRRAAVGRGALGVIALTVSMALPARALAAGSPVTTPSTVPPAAPAPTGPQAGKMTLKPRRVGGSPPFALVARHIDYRGVVAPFVAGQTVKVSFYRDGRKVGVESAPVLALANGTGQFDVHFTSRYAGRLQARAAHYATPQQGAFSASAPVLQVVNVDLGLGSQGPSVRLLQSELDALHYAVPLNGSFEEGTGRALIAYRKMTDLERIPYAGRQVFELLARRAGQFHVRYPADGRHVEANLTKQVLAEIEPGGRVRTIYTTSSGKPSTPTVIGRFRVYLKTPGENSEGMVDSNYFIRGYAIHGYAEVPTYAASHGCLRVPVPDAPAIYAWVREGTPVDVYNEDGGGSARVRANAGP
jgi:peptidoglycan hydrolase-like protein with peptidoglycan-binding domain